MSCIQTEMKACSKLHEKHKSNTRELHTDVCGIGWACKHKVGAVVVDGMNQPYMVLNGEHAKKWNFEAARHAVGGCDGAVRKGAAVQAAGAPVEADGEAQWFYMLSRDEYSRVCAAVPPHTVTMLRTSETARERRLLSPENMLFRKPDTEQVLYELHRALELDASEMRTEMLALRADECRYKAEWEAMDLAYRITQSMCDLACCEHTAKRTKRDVYARTNEWLEGNATNTCRLRIANGETVEAMTDAVGEVVRNEKNLLYIVLNEKFIRGMPKPGLKHTKHPRGGDEHTAWFYMLSQEEHDLVRRQALTAASTACGRYS